MSTGGIIAIVVVAVIVLLVAMVIGAYNGLVKLDERVNEAWSDITVQLKYRADLIPNLVNTVKGYATHEEGTLTKVVEARAKATQPRITFEQLNEQTLQQFNRTQGELSSALSRLMVISEQYPNLKANENFRDLQAQLEGTENRISVERRKFNEEVKQYNAYVRSFPRNIIARMFNFSPKPYFEANAGAEKAPEVKF